MNTFTVTNRVVATLIVQRLRESGLKARIEQDDKAFKIVGINCTAADIKKAAK